MTPQGMTLTENYLLISAYCYDHRHHSVIYVLDRQTGIHLKTIPLPDLPHAGGLAYDPIHKKSGSAILLENMQLWPRFI